MGAEAPQVYTVSRDAKERARGGLFEETASSSPFVIFPIVCSAPAMVLRKLKQEQTTGEMEVW